MTLDEYLVKMRRSQYTLYQGLWNLQAKERAIARLEQLHQTRGK